MTAFSTQDFIDLLTRTTDPGWLQPILADTDSSTLLNALIAEFVRLSSAADQSCLQGAISTASGGSPGTAVLTLSRTAGGTSGTIPSGYRFVDQTGTTLLATDNIPVASGATIVVVHVTSVRENELINTSDDNVVTIDPQAQIIKDSLGTTVLIAPAGSAGIIATTFTTVASATQILGGVCDYLSLHGRERGQLRQPNEDTSHYRLRVRNIPDAVAPIAVADGVLGAATQVNLPTPSILEPFEDGASAALKMLHRLGRFDPQYFNSADFFDDLGSGREMVSRREARAYFRIDIPAPIKDPDGLRLFYDDGFFDDPVFGFADVTDHPAVIASLMAVWEEANRKRAGGVQFDEFLDLTTKVIGHGSAVGAGESSAWTLTPPVGKLWWYRDGWADHDTAGTGSMVDPTVMYDRIKFTFEDSTVFRTPPWFPLWSQRLDVTAMIGFGFPFKRIKQVDGIARSDGLTPLNVVGQFTMLEVVA